MHFVIHSIRVLGFFSSFSSVRLLLRYNLLIVQCSQLTKDVVFSRDASEFSLLLSKILSLSIPFLCFCSRSVRMLLLHIIQVSCARDIFCISCVPAERPEHTYWAMAKRRGKKNERAREKSVAYAKVLFPFVCLSTCLPWLDAFNISYCVFDNLYFSISFYFERPFVAILMAAHPIVVCSFLEFVANTFISVRCNSMYALCPRCF